MSWYLTLADKDSVFFQVSYFDAESGDLAQYYNQARASQTLRVTEKQRPNLLAGYHREWAPGSHTLFLATRFDDTLTLNDSAPAIFFLRTRNVLAGTDTRLLNPPVSLQYQRDLEAYSAELQHIFQTPKHTLVFGGRFQTAQTDTASALQQFGFPVTSQKLEANLDRESVYGYEQWQILEKLRLTAGLSYDRLHFPNNVDTSPITSAESTVDRLSPKVGLLWTPCQNTHLRAAYTRSLGGAFLDASVRLEPAQVAGFNQAFRSLIPESVAGLVPGTKFETWGAGVDHTFKGTYFAAEGEIIKSTATRSFGVLTNSDLDFPAPDSASSARPGKILCRGVG